MLSSWLPGTCLDLSIWIWKYHRNIVLLFSTAFCGISHLTWEFQFTHCTYVPVYNVSYLVMPVQYMLFLPVSYKLPLCVGLSLRFLCTVYTFDSILCGRSLLQWIWCLVLVLGLLWSVPQHLSVQPSPGFPNVGYLSCLNYMQCRVLPCLPMALFCLIFLSCLLLLQTFLSSSGWCAIPGRWKPPHIVVSFWVFTSVTISPFGQFTV